LGEPLGGDRQLALQAVDVALEVIGFRLATLHRRPFPPFDQLDDLQLDAGRVIF
jgi:hypothetical protein